MKALIVCDFNIQATAELLPTSSCNFPCAGDANLTCGGPLTISVYQNHNANVGPMPANKPVVNNWIFSGCVTSVYDFLTYRVRKTTDLKTQ